MIFIGKVKKKRRFYKVDYAYWQDWFFKLIGRLGTMDIKVKNKVIGLNMAIFFILASSTAFSLSDKEIINYAYEKYPIIVSEKYINHTQAKELVYSIPKKYYEYVNVIEFIIQPIRIYTTNGYFNNFGGYVYAYWDKHHNCFNGKIILSQINQNLLIHELGHIYEICILKKNISTEEFANNFRIK